MNLKNKEVVHVCFKYYIEGRKMERYKIPVESAVVTDIFMFPFLLLISV